MNKEPFALYIFRVLVGFGLLIFMMLLYWSSELIEQDMKAIRVELAEIKYKLSTIHLQHPIQNSDTIPVSSSDTHRDSNYPNLLKPDPYYTTTLPKLLGPSFRPYGTLRDATYMRPINLHPFSVVYPVPSWVDDCTISVASTQFGKYETLAPSMAIRMEERPTDDKKAIEFWVYLRNDLYWQPLNPTHFPSDMHLAEHFLKPHRVTAHDFKLYFDAIMNPHVQVPAASSLRTNFQDVESFRIIDDHTFVVRWKTVPITLSDGHVEMRTRYSAAQWTGGLRALPVFVFTYFPDGQKIIEDDTDPEIYRNNSIWAQQFEEHWAKNIIASCGMWLFDGMGDRSIRFKRNSQFFSPYYALTEGKEIEFKQAPEGVWQDFKAGKLDVYTLPPMKQLELKQFLDSSEYKKQQEKGLGINTLEYSPRSFTWIAWNTNNSFFNSRKVRQAMTMAIDRQRIVDHLLGGMGNTISGPLHRFSKEYDPSIEPLPFDPREAQRLLHEEGWQDTDGDGILDKEIDGKRIPFHFSLSYYVKNPTSKMICEYVSTALKEIGIRCDLNGLDGTDLSTKMDDKDFEALYLTWLLEAPPMNPGPLWNSTFAKEKGSQNITGFADAEVDEIIHQLDYEPDSKVREKLYFRLHAIMHEEQPYTFLYNSKAVLLYREYVRNLFIPADRQDLVPGADVAQPSVETVWLEPHEGDDV